MISSSPQELWRGYLAMLDYTSFRRWARDAAHVALAQVVDPTAHVAVITSGPPHMAHEAGRIVAKRSGLPLVLDMRDPWGIDEGLDFEAAGDAVVSHRSALRAARRRRRPR